MHHLYYCDPMTILIIIRRATVLSLWLAALSTWGVHVNSKIRHKLIYIVGTILVSSEDHAKRQELNGNRALLDTGNSFL